MRVAARTEAATNARPSLRRLLRCIGVQRQLRPTLFRDLGHEGQNVVFGVAELDQPEVMGGHGRDQYGLVHEMDASRLEGFIGFLNVGHLKI